MASPIQFTPVRVSTMTVTAMISRPCNLIDMAKYAPLDEEIIGIKLSYGKQHIHRGNTKVSKHFLNQITLALRLPPDHKRLLSCKIFHNGHFHITGVNNLDEAQIAAQVLVNKLYNLQGFSRINLKTLPKPFDSILCSHDDLLFSASGECIGAIVFDDDQHVKKITMRNEIVEPGTLLGADGNKVWIFITQKWGDKKIKTMYSFNGDIIGTRRLDMDVYISKRHFDVTLGYVYVKDQIVGKEIVEMVEGWEDKMHQNNRYRLYMKEKSYVLHPFQGVQRTNGEHELTITPDNLVIDMMNVNFNASIHVSKVKLHETFLRHDLDSTYESGSSLGCNLRFMSNPSTVGTANEGRCICTSVRSCSCKGIFVACYPSGAVSIKGVKSMEQAELASNFIKRFYIQHEKSILG